MSVRNALILAFLLSDVLLFVILRAWHLDHPTDDPAGATKRKGRTTIYDLPPSQP